MLLIEIHCAYPFLSNSWWSSADFIDLLNICHPFYRLNTIRLCIAAFEDEAYLWIKLKFSPGLVSYITNKT